MRLEAESRRTSVSLGMTEEAEDVVDALGEDEGVEEGIERSTWPSRVTARKCESDSSDEGE